MKKAYLVQQIITKLNIYQQETLESINIQNLHCEVQEQFQQKVNNFYRMDEELFITSYKRVIHEWGFDALDHKIDFNIELLESLRQKNKINQDNFNLFSSQLKEANKNAATDFKTLIQNQQMLEIINHYFKIFDQKRKSLIAELIAKMTEIERMTRGLKVFKGIFGNFWDLTIRVLEKIDMSFVEKMNELLAKKEFIQRIAELLGRLANSQNKLEERLIKEMILIPSLRRSFNSPTNTTGVKFGNDLPIILPHQLAMRRNKTLNTLFKMQFAEKKLLELEQNEKIMDELEKTRLTKITRFEDKGPFILCIDTSGSMQGEPEIIAKAMTMAIIRIANKENRKVFIINFSVKISEYEVSDLGKNFDKFFNFLSHSFCGGTDIEPAIENAIAKAKDKDYQNADIIMISDFIINSLSTKLDEEVQLLKEKKVRFHALSIGDSQITKHMNFFDNNWVYDGSQESIDKIIDDLNHLAEQASNK